MLPTVEGERLRGPCRNSTPGGRGSDSRVESLCMWVVVKIRVPFWVPIKSTAPIIQGTQKGTLILTTTHVCVCVCVQ